MALSQLSARFSDRQVFGDPIVTDDHATIVPVSRVRDGASTSIGIFVIRDGSATWVPAVDANRIALMGVATGFVAATLGCLAVLKRPPWPDTVIRVTKHH